MNKLFTFIILIGIIYCVSILLQRDKIEKENKNIELCLDYRSFEEVCNIYGLDKFTTLRKFKNSGITSVALSENSIKELRDKGKILYSLGSLEGKVYILIRNKEIYEELYQWLKIKLDENLVIKRGRLNEYYSLEVNTPNLGYLEEVKVSVYEPDLKEIKKIGLLIISRIENFYNIDAAKINNIFELLPSIHTIIFSGEEVLGYKNKLTAVSNCMMNKNINFGYIEFAVQRGEEKLARLLKEKVIRVHSIHPGELKEMHSLTAIDRFVRAVRERNIRICYINLFLNKDLDYNLAYISKLKKRLEDSGFNLGKVNNFSRIEPNKILVCIILISSIAALMVILGNLGYSNKQLFIFILLSLATLLVFYLAPLLTKKIIALLIAIIYPVLAIVISVRDKGQGVRGKELKYEGIKELFFIIYQFLAITIVTLIGGLFIAAILSDTMFILKIEQFRGVKLSFILPLFIIFLILINRFFNLVEFLKKPILIYHTIIVTIFAIIIVVLITRTGHEMGLFTSIYELKLRQFLENIFGARPRIKEAFFAHPLLILGLYYFLKNNTAIATPFIILGAIGQVSIINTFCHIHTPIHLSLLRTINGVVIGIILGIILIFIVQLYNRYVEVVRGKG